ncbi:hypothetical protein ACH5RR_038327 [Cinchona calisaya]|uniref:Uncharacterized protein n=1 Tax=Cinchona calisaya TaxID=153742 RepID=A0ABD2Y0Q9_9GENT
MAKLSVTVAVSVTVLLFSLIVSQARIPSNTPEDDVINRELPQSSPDSDITSFLRLPSHTVSDESPSTELAGDIPESEPISVRSTPLSVVRFHPINGHFPIRSRFPFRRNCHHHHHFLHHDRPFFKPIIKQHVEQIPFGNDMILSTNENNNEFDPLMFHHRRVRRIPATWVKFHRHHDDDDDRADVEDDGFSKYVLKHSHRFGKEKFKKHLHHHDRDDKEDEEKMVNYEEMMKNREEKKEENSGFVNRIRKFLNHF